MTDDAHAGAELREPALFRTAFRFAPIGMAIADEQGRIQIANDALGRITGYAAAELSERAIEDLVDPEDRDLLVGDQKRLLAGELSCYDVRLRLRRLDRSRCWVAITVAQGDPRPRSFIYQIQDISERLEIEGRLEYLIDHDFLTGLFNRRRFEQELARQLELQHRFGGGGAVLMVDLDGFKEVNDRFGHAAGDELLRGLSAALRARTRVTDVLARLSGDEFAILLPGAGRTEAQTVAEEVIDLVRRHVTLLGSEHAQVTASVGIALFDGLTDVQLLALADAAMYVAKQGGRDRFAVLTAGDKHTTAASQAGEANRLRRALDEHRFVLHCQPIWDLRSAGVAWYELLIRMKGDEARDLIEPSSFLFAAERFGLIGEIDRWVVSQAVALIAEQRRRDRSIVLAVNLSARSVREPELMEHIDRELDESGIDPSSLVFELTETSAIANLEATESLSRHLQHRGCRFALDDFGAGFASFHYLKNLPFDLVKIDGDFVRGLSQNPIDQLVIAAVVTLATGMGKQTVAEFVADQQTADLLLAAGVDFAQGFHIARPQPVEQVLG